MRRAYSSLAMFGAARFNQPAVFIMIGVLSLVLGLWIPSDRSALAATLVAVTIGVVVWSAVSRRQARPDPASPAGAVPPPKSRTYLVPRELPPGPADFVGRAEQLQELTEAIQRPRDAAPFIAVIHGAAGIGKTALAITFARRMASLFPAGQLFVQIRGTPNRPGTAEELIRHFVAALKSPGELMPSDASELEARYLKLTEGEPVLFVLDDVPADFDITALRPGSPACAFVVTCRAEPDWPVVSCAIGLGELGESEALSMLRTTIGEDRVDSEERPTRDLAILCGREPQALRAAGTAVANRPDWEIRLILEQAAWAFRRAAGQRGGSGIFDATYALLTTDEQRALQAVGALQRPEVRPWMLAAALHTSEARGHRLASRLADAGLLERYNPGSGAPAYHAEEPILNYASLQVTDDEFAETVRQLVNAAEQHRSDESLAALDELLKGRGDDGFTSAIDQVRSALSSAQERRSRAGEAEAGAALAEIYADLGDMLGAEELAYRAIAISADVAGCELSRARAGRCLVRIERRRHRLDSAIEHADRALADAAQASDQLELIRIQQEKAVVLAVRGQLRAARDMSEAALGACGRLGAAGAPLRPGVLWSLGTVLFLAGGHAEAAAVLADGKREALEHGHPRMSAWIDLVSAQVAGQVGDHDAGERYATAAMEAFTALRHRYGTAYCRYQLGQISLSRGQVEEASRSLREALETFHNCADNWVEGEVSLVLAEAYRRRGQVRAAIGLQLAARRTYHRMNGQAEAWRATRALLRTLLTGLPAKFGLIRSTAPSPDGG